MPAKSDLNALVLATALGSVAAAPMILEVELHVKPIRRIAETIDPPLDLEANVFHYRIDDGRIIPVHDGTKDANGTGVFADATRNEAHRHPRAIARRGSGSRRSWSAASRPRRRR